MYVKVYMKLSELRTDPIQYKPNSPVLTMDEALPVYVAIEVKKELVHKVPSVLHEESDLPENAVVLTPQGLADMMGQIAMAIRNRLSE